MPQFITEPGSLVDHHLTHEDGGSDEVIGLVPPGGIIMWHGTIATIPVGFIICDGNNSTPNLLGRFVEGVATAATNPGTIGGATSKTTTGHQHDGGIGYRAADSRIGINSTPDLGASIGVVGDIWTRSGSVPGNEYLAVKTASNTDSILDIRPQYYDIAFLMKT